MSPVPVSKLDVRLLPDPSRRIIKTYLPGEPAPTLAGMTRPERLIRRVLELSPDQIRRTLGDVMAQDGNRHDFDQVLRTGFSRVEQWVPDGSVLSEDTRRLIGAYFLHQYSLEGAALTNPSIVASPDQSGVTAGSLRVVISLRAVGEGHISSVEFRSGVIGPAGDVLVDEPAAPSNGTRRTPLFDRRVFEGKLAEMGTDPAMVAAVLEGLDERFTMESLEAAVSRFDDGSPRSPALQQVIHVVHWLASSNYKVGFGADTDLSQRVLTPNGPAESRGMEDARFVRFVEDDGSVLYYGTYTAFDGFSILPQLIETDDFRNFRVATLNGEAAVNKGMALFPRRIGGRYVALGRSDGESNYLMVSDHVRFWHEAHRFQVPAMPWELLQIGNAGSPIETEAGWLVITHGVGPMRRYALGAVLLDLDEPHRVIGHLSEPLLTPDPHEAEGYVPNVVYSCGSIVHDGQVIIPYGASDTSTAFAAVPLDALLSALVSR